MHSFFSNILPVWCCHHPVFFLSYPCVYLSLNKFTWQSACQGNLIFLGFCSPIFNIDGFLQVFNDPSSPCILKTLMQCFNVLAAPVLIEKIVVVHLFFFICGGRITHSWGCLHTLFFVRHSLKCLPMVLTHSSILTLEAASLAVSFSGSMVDSTDWNGCILLSLPDATHLLFPLRESHCVPSWLSCLCLLCWCSMPWTSTAGWCVEESQRCSAFTACWNHPPALPRSFEYMPGFKPKIQAHWSSRLLGI